MTGRFITFEGGEGAGKSTQILRLADSLERAGVFVQTTREPGGSPDADAIRELLVRGEPERWNPTSEALLNYAARHSHLESFIRPALNSGKFVLCDRFADSSRAYQGIAGEVGLDLIEQLDADIVGETQPDLTIIFDLDPAIGLQRAKARGGADRFEKKGLEFHQRLREAFAQVADANPNRCVVVDASASIEVLSESIWSLVSEKLLSGKTP